MDVVLTLPDGVTFTDGQEPTIAGTSTLTFEVVDFTNDDRDVATFPVDVVSSVAATATIGNIHLEVAEGFAAGPIVATLTAGDVLNQTLTLATAANSGIVVTVVDGGDAYSDTPDALEADELPVSPAGRLNVATASINITENFTDDLSDGDSLTLTLPAGVTFFATYDIEFGSAATPADPIADPTGFATSTITMNEAGDIEGDMLLGDGNSLRVIIDASVAPGPVTAVLSGTVAGETMTPVNLDILEIVETGVTLSPADDIPLSA
jgi:hypothetical protein